MNIHLFNPENDLALAAEASGIRNYTPPKGALAVGYGGALLPLWWAEENDCVLLPPRLTSGEYDRYCSQAEEMRQTYGLKGRIANPEELKASGECGAAIPLPWGWSRYARHRFEESGVEPKFLPNDARLTSISLLSHRRNTIRLNKELTTRPVLPPTPGEPALVFPPIPMEIKSFEMLTEKLANQGQFMIKLPWSCSSRGVMKLSYDELEFYRSRIEGMIRRQGSVMVEKYLTVSTKVCDGVEKSANDFAALFESDGYGKVSFRAWSVFKTDSNGRYWGNIVAPQKDIKRRIPVEEGVREQIVNSLETALSDLLGHCYKGWMGIDMMVWNPGSGRLGIAPCLELNLRQTMGVAAWRIANLKTFDRPMVLNATDRGIVLTDEK